MQKELKRIKDKYGEEFSHLCRELFPTLLETEGLLYDLLINKFYPSKFLYSDIVNNKLEAKFRNFINSLLISKERMEIDTDKTPEELLDSVGYNLFECENENDIQKFKKYYKEGEELCTFRGRRLESNYVFFAVKKNVDDIKRENFENPERQDEYGTSVISIQFTRPKPNYVSIKNRYNLTVTNPDCTFGNNLDNIITGLTKSFENNYGFSISKKNEYDLEIPGYVRANDGKFYKYNYEIRNIYYCTDNIIIDNFQVKRNYQEKERYIIFDYFILDMKEKTISLYDNRINDSFVECNKNIEKIEIRKENDKKYIVLKKSNHQIIIVLDKENKIIAYHNDLLTKIGDNFLCYNKSLKAIYLDNVKNIGDFFIGMNTTLEYIHIPLLKRCGSDFLKNNNCAKEISFLNLEYVGNYFMTQNRGLEYLEFPNLIKAGDFFIAINRNISFFYAPDLEEVGSHFLSCNNGLVFLNFPRLRRFGAYFLNQNQVLKELRFQRLERIDSYYLNSNKVLETLEIPENISNKFIYNGVFKNNFIGKQKKLTLVMN